MIGLVTTSTRGVSLVPTFASEPIMGTNPIAFAAPARRNPAFILDMATTTVAAGRAKVKKLNHQPLPAGWVVDGDGRAVTDETQAFHHVFESPDGGISPLGGTRDLGSHKGYGLAVLVHILAGTLTGASFSPIRNRTQRPSDPHNIGHFFLAIDPKAFRPDGGFEADLDQVLDARGRSAPDPSAAGDGGGRPRAGHARRAQRSGDPGAATTDGSAPRRRRRGEGAVRPRLTRRAGSCIPLPPRRGEG